MSESAEASSKHNVEVVRRYLRVFETKQVAELGALRRAGLVPEQVPPL
ncbi:hypothetical protein [Streptomyces platensis]